MGVCVSRRAAFRQVAVAGLTSTSTGQRTVAAGPGQLRSGKGLKRTSKVGSYKPNRLGLYDMHGNAWQWCADEVKTADGSSLRVARGGGWFNDANYSRAAHGGALLPWNRDYDRGLRLARILVGKESK